MTNGPEDRGFEPQRFEVKEGLRWGKLVGRGEIFTTGIQSCVGVCVYSPMDSLAILGHFSTIEPAAETAFAEMMLEADNLISNYRPVKLWAGGGEITSADILKAKEGLTAEDLAMANTEALDFRDLVMESLEKRVNKGAKLRTWWLKRPGTINYSRDVATGQEFISINHDL